MTVISFLKDDGYGEAETLGYVFPIADALGQLSHRALVVSENAANMARELGQRGHPMPQPGAITRVATNVDVLLVSDQLDQFGCASLVQEYRDEGVYTHILIDSGGEGAANIMYQVGGATSDLTVILLAYSQLPEHDDSAAAFEWITSQAPSPPQPPAAATLQPWIRWCTAELGRQFGTLAQQGQALFGSEVWDAQYEPSLAYLAFEAWVAVNPADQYEFRPEWNLGRPLRDVTKSLAYLGELEKLAQAPLEDRDYLGVQERPHRTAALCVNVDRDHRYWAPIACRLSANGPVTVLHTAIPFAPDEPQQFHETLTGQRIYRQAAAEIDQLASHCEGSCPLPVELVTHRRSPAQRGVETSDSPGRRFARSCVLGRVSV